MTTNTNSTETDDDLANDPTLLLYRRILANETTSSPALDQAILEGYKRHFKPPFWKRWCCQFNQEGDLSFNWSLVGALAMGLMVGIAIPTPEQELVGTPDVVGFKGGDPQPVNDTTNAQDVTKDPQKWLAKIADLTYDGNIKQAEQELIQFKQRYPDYQPQSK